MKIRRQIKWINRIKRECVAYIKHGKRVPSIPEGLEKWKAVELVDGCSTAVRIIRNRKRYLDIMGRCN